MRVKQWKWRLTKIVITVPRLYHWATELFGDRNGLTEVPLKPNKHLKAVSLIGLINNNNLIKLNKSWKETTLTFRLNILTKAWADVLKLNSCDACKYTENERTIIKTIFLYQATSFHNVYVRIRQWFDRRCHSFIELDTQKIQWHEQKLTILPGEITIVKLRLYQRNYSLILLKIMKLSSNGSKNSSCAT